MFMCLEYVMLTDVCTKIRAGARSCSPCLEPCLSTALPTSLPLLLDPLPSKNPPPCHVSCAPSALQPQEFVDEVKRDRLAGLFALLERRAPGQQPHLLVCGLSHHLSLTETRQHQAAMRGQVGAREGGPWVRRGAGGGSSSGVQARGSSPALVAGGCKHFWAGCGEEGLSWT